MPNEIYEVAAQAARYWFLFLMALIVWRSWRWFARDRKQRKKRLRLLPDAGFVGELVVQTGGAEMPPGLALPVAREGTLGSVRGADIYAPAKGVAKKHLWFEFDDENGLYVEPYGHNSADVDGQPLLGRRTHAWLAHGSRLTVGDAVLRLRMFAGFEHAGVKAADGLAFSDEGAWEAPPGMAAFTPAQLAAMQAAGMAAPQLTPQQLAAMQAMWQGTPGYTPQQLAAMQAQWQAAQGYTPEQLAAMQAASMPVPQIMPQQVAQGYTAAQLAAMQAQAAHAIRPGATPPAGGVLTTATGAFVPPPRVTAVKPILSADEADAPDEQPEAAQPLRHHRAASVSPLDAAQADGAYGPLMDGYAEGGADANGGHRSMDGAYADSPWAQAPDGQASYAPATHDHTFAPRVTFYPPVMDDESGAPLPADDPPADGFAGPADESWPYAAYPQSDARFVSSGYTYPEHIEPDVPYEYADEDEAPRSLYVEPDEAEKAKRLLWDKYLKGGRR